MALFFSVARKLAPYRVPMIGVNQGHLGFLTQVPREQMVHELTGMLTGKYLPKSAFCSKLPCGATAKPCKPRSRSTTWCSHAAAPAND